MNFYFPDLDYESQFMFPNGFVDQNGIYYVNSKYITILTVYIASSGVVREKSGLEVFLYFIFTVYIYF